MRAAGLDYVLPFRLLPEERSNQYWIVGGSGHPSGFESIKEGFWAVDPRNGHALLFGGLQLTGPDTLPVQTYAGDTWEWDGTTWKQLATNGTPPARENAPFTFDPLRNEFVMFGGYGGYYLSDIWSLANPATAGDPMTWRPWADSPLRRRAAGR